MLICLRCMQVGMPYHLRVLVPCYKESYDIVTRTLEVCPAHARQTGACACMTLLTVRWGL